MLRGALLAFVGGWIAWFWIDKTPAALGPLPWPTDGELLQNFQVAVDLAKQARFKAAFVYIWKAHYLVLSLGLGLVFGMGFNALGRLRGRRRFRALYLPNRRDPGDRDGT